MRQRRLRTVILFATHAQACAFEEAAERLGLGGRAIPVPGQLRAGCGTAWLAPDDDPGFWERVERAGLAFDEVGEALLYG